MQNHHGVYQYILTVYIYITYITTPKPPSKIRTDSRPKLKGKDVRLQKELDDFMVGMPGLLGGQEFLGTISSEDFKRYQLYTNTHYTSLYIIIHIHITCVHILTLQLGCTSFSILTKFP